MDKKEIELLNKYSYYSHVLKKMGEIPLKKDIVLAKDTGIKDKEIQMAYNDIKKIEFEGSIVDYLGWISTAYLVYETKREARDYKKGHIPVIALELFQKTWDRNPYDKVNMSRLFNKNPEYLINLLEEIFFESKLDPFRYIHAFSHIRDMQTMDSFIEKGIDEKYLKMVRKANLARYTTLLNYIEDLSLG